MARCHDLNGLRTCEADERVVLVWEGAGLKAAGWVAVDRTQQDAVIHAVLASMGKQTYTEIEPGISLEP